MQAEDTEDLKKKMELLVRLFAIHLVNGKSQREQIRLLSIAGMGPKDIADLLGTTPNTVNVALSALRKKGNLNLKSEGAKEDAG
jgi:DNA-binding CsgD family transcriptional regulator